MKVSIRAYGMLQEKIKSRNWITVDLSEGTTIAELLITLNMHNDEVMNVVIEGKLCHLDYVIQEGDKLELLPLISAG